MREGRIGLAWLRLDGFVALEADHQGGTVITRPFELEGECLQLNVDASGNGDVRLELLDRAGNPIPTKFDYILPGQITTTCRR